MNMNRPAIKRQARELIRSSRSLVITGTLILFAVLLLLAFLSYKLTGMSVNDTKQFYDLLDAGDFERAYAFSQSHGPSAGANLIDLLLEAVTGILSAGYLIFLLNVIRGTGAEYGNLLDGFGIWWRVILLNVVVSILVTLWSLLLIIPGIIASYRYRMAQYLLITHPEYSIMDCIRESKQLMKGRKWEIFVLHLSFIGWFLLCAIPIAGWILLLWVIPYANITELLYFERYSGQGAYAVSENSYF